MKRRLILLVLLLVCGAASARAEFSFPGVFLPDGAPAARTETSYRSASLAIEISLQRVENSDVYVADIHMRDVSCFRRAFGGGAWGVKSQEVEKLAEDSGALLAMTGDNAHRLSCGWLVGNGEVLRSTANSQRDLCLLYMSGEMRTVLAQEVDTALLAGEADALWQVFCFGPALLDADGKALSRFNSSVKPANPRSVIGYYEPGHYCFVQVDGRRTPSALNHRESNSGLTMAQLATFMEELGCRAAYNLDGGQSSLLWYCGQVISTPYKGGRRVGDIVLVTEPAAP